MKDCGRSNRAKIVGCEALCFLPILDFLIFHLVSSAGAALSPSGLILAATNMYDGIDWYSITRREYVSTTYYDVQGDSRSRRLVGITFLDEVTVLAGHVDGQIVLATATMTNGPRLFTLRRKPSKSNREDLLALCTPNLIHR
jgi:hypothetical protein